MKSSFSTITLGNLDLTSDNVRPYYNNSGLALSGEVAQRGRYLSDYISAGAMAGAASGSATASSISYSTTHYFDTWTFDPASQNSVTFTFGFPDTWDNQNVKAKLFWGISTGISGVVFGIQSIGYVSGNTLNSALGPETLISGYASASGLIFKNTSPSITITGSLSGSDTFTMFKISRKVSDAFDNCVGNAILYGAQIQYKESSTEPSIW